MNPPLTMDGITATHFARARTVSGMLLSGVAISSSSTLAASFKRSVTSVRSSFGNANADKARSRKPSRMFFMLIVQSLKRDPSTHNVIAQLSQGLEQFQQQLTNFRRAALSLLAFGPWLKSTHEA